MRYISPKIIRLLVSLDWQDFRLGLHCDIHLLIGRVRKIVESDN